MFVLSASKVVTFLVASGNATQSQVTIFSIIICHKY